MPYSICYLKLPFMGLWDDTKKIRIVQKKKAERVREMANLSVPTEWKLLVVTEKLDE